MTQTAEPAAMTPIEVEVFVLRSVRESWETIKSDPVLFIVGSVLVAVVSVVSLGVLAGPMFVGFIQLVQRRRRGQAAKIGDVREGLSLFASSFVAFLVIAVATCIGMLLLVIPGLMVLIATCFAFHEIAYRKLHAADALRASFHIAKRNLLHVLIVLVGVAALNALAEIVPFALLLTVPFGAVWMTVAYEILTGQAPEGSALAVEPEPAA